MSKEFNKTEEKELETKVRNIWSNYLTLDSDVKDIIYSYKGIYPFDICNINVANGYIDIDYSYSKDKGNLDLYFDYISFPIEWLFYYINDREYFGYKIEEQKMWDEQAEKERRYEELKEIYRYKEAEFEEYLRLKEEFGDLK